MMKGLNLKLCVRISLMFIGVYAGALLIPVATLELMIIPLLGNSILWLPLAVVLMVIDFLIFIIMCVLCSGFAARVSNLKYSGRHRLDMRNKAVTNWLITLVIYLPTAVLLDFLHLYPLKSLHIRMFGGKIGKNVIIGGLITDPCLLQVGDNANVGGFSTVLCHAVERTIIQFKPVKIGKECGIGTRATVLAGAVMEDRSFLAAQSFLPKNTLIPRGQIYGGVPAAPWIEPKRWGGKQS